MLSSYWSTVKHAVRDRGKNSGRDLVKLLKNSCQIGAMDIEVISDLLNTKCSCCNASQSHACRPVELIGWRWMAPMDIGAITDKK